MTFSRPWRPTTKSIPITLTDRVRRVMKAAGFFDPKDTANEEDMQKLRDFHSFRVTWVTLALTAGVLLEIVRRVTGHRTAEIVMKHYSQLGRDEFRRTLAGKLPALLGGPAEDKPLDLDELREKLPAMKPQTWKKIRAELFGRLPPPPAKAAPVDAKVATARRLTSSAPPLERPRGG